MDEEKILDLQHDAQQAAELRLMTAVDMLMSDDSDWQPEWDDLAGPFCGCDTCVVREVLDAAWPFLRQVALLRGDDDGPR